MTWTYDTISKTLTEMVEENHSGLVKALLAMELGVSNPSILDSLYQDFMAIDDLSLVSEELRMKAEEAQKHIQEELTDLLDKLYRTGEGASFVMETIASNSISNTIEQYEILDRNDYSKLTLETLQEIIQKELDLTSQDYFGDVTVIALQKDLLDQRSQFLQHYVANLLDTTPPTKDQRALVLD